MEIKPYNKKTNTLVIDASSGEVIDQFVSSEEVLYVDKTDEYYTRLFDPFYKFIPIFTHTELKLALICSKVSYINKNIVHTKDMLKFMNGRMVYKAINTLIENKFLFKVSKGVYLINPIFFWKGYGKERTLLIKELYLQSKLI